MEPLFYLILDIQYDLKSLLFKSKFFKYTIKLSL